MHTIPIQESRQFLYSLDTALKYILTVHTQVHAYICLVMEQHVDAHTTLYTYTRGTYELIRWT